MKEATRESYGKTLLEIGEDKNVVVLDADVSSSTKTNMFAEKYPERFFNNGISEADMVSQAAGFASEGKIVFASSFAAFLVGRAYDQIRCSIAYSNMNVKLVATHSGLNVGEDGATHQMLEDIALVRVLPNMEVYTASTSNICKEIVRKIYEKEGPCYLRLYRGKAEELYDNLEENEILSAIETGMIGKGIKDKKLEEHKIILITMGDMTEHVYNVQKRLEEEGIYALVIDVFKLKPFNELYLINILKNIGNSNIPIITIEDHSIYGGLNSIICETLSKHLPRKVYSMGMKEFGKSGNQEDVLKYFKLDEENIYKYCKKVSLNSKI